MCLTPRQECWRTYSGGIDEPDALVRDRDQATHRPGLIGRSSNSRSRQTRASTRIPKSTAPAALSPHVKFTAFTWATFCRWHRDVKRIFKQLIYNGFLYAKHSSPCRSVGDILSFGATQLVFETIAVQ